MKHKNYLIFTSIPYFYSYYFYHPSLFLCLKSQKPRAQNTQPIFSSIWDVHFPIHDKQTISISRLP